MKILEAKKIAVEKFNSSPIDAVKATPLLDADLLMSHVTGFDRSEMILKRNAELSHSQKQQFFSAVEKRATGFPVAYIIGHKEFFGLDFTVTPDVLIPKPDTEILVEKTLEIINQKFETMRKKKQSEATSAREPQLKICDVCTGSGCVGISIIHNLPFTIDNYQLTLADISLAALDVARKNASRLLNEKQLPNIKFLQGDLFDAVDKDDSVCNAVDDVRIASTFSTSPQTFDIIVSNPPYIPSTMVDELLKDGRSEPRLALDGDADLKAANGAENDGLSIIRRLVPQAHEHLTDGGYFLCETGEYNAYEAAEIFKASGFSSVTIFNDLAGSPRVVCGQK